MPLFHRNNSPASALRVGLIQALGLAINGATTMKKLIVLAFLAALGWYGYGKLKAMSAPLPHAGTELSPAGGAQNRPQDVEASQFACDGRTHCSQMTSCAEATYFIQHCPNTQMDGNNDGEPCEQQGADAAVDTARVPKPQSGFGLNELLGRTAS